MPAPSLTVVQLVPSLNGGGVERGTVEVNEELVRKGHRSIVISGGGKLVDRIRADGGEHLDWPIGKKSPLTLRLVPRLRSLLRRERVDILHARSRVPAWVGWMARKSIFGRRPHFVTTVHGLYSVSRYSAIMTRGERVIAISESVAEYVRQNYPQARPERLRLIPRGVDPDEFPRGFQPSQDWLENWYQSYPELMGRPVISLVGRITRVKGHLDFLAVVARLRFELPELRALIVGGEDPNRLAYAAEVRDRVRELELDDVVIFTGNRSDIREIYSVSNVVMSLTSDPPEAFGRTTVEALNMGIPVVGFHHGGTGEILSNIFPQGVVPVGDIAAAARAVRKILDQGADIPSDHPYLKQRMLEQTLAVYEELAA